jgi:hypothetical protein
MGHIYIIYADECLALTKCLAEALEAEGYTTWYRARDAGPDRDFEDQARQAIGEAVAVVCVCPRRWGAPPPMTWERWIAEGAGKLILDVPPPVREGPPALPSSVDWCRRAGITHWVRQELRRRHLHPEPEGLVPDEGPAGAAAETGSVLPEDIEDEQTSSVKRNDRPDVADEARELALLFDVSGSVPSPESAGTLERVKDLLRSLGDAEVRLYFSAHGAPKPPAGPETPEEPEHQTGGPASDEDLGLNHPMCPEEGPPGAVAVLFDGPVDLSSGDEEGRTERWVNIRHAASGREWTVQVPSRAPLRELLPALLARLGLPLMTSDGAPVSYKLCKAGGIRLAPFECLAEAGVRDGAVLHLLEDMIPGGGPLPAAPPITSLRLSAFHPKEVVPGETHRLLAYAHRAWVEVGKEALEVLGAPAQDVRGVSGPAKREVAASVEVQVIPQGEGLTFSPAQQSLHLWDDSQRAEFRFRAACDHEGRACNGTLTFLVEGFLLGDLAFSVFVRDRATQAVFPGEAASVSASPQYRRIFASYSRRDEPVVRLCERAVQALGDEYLRDLVALRSGEEWSPRLLELIDEADLFQLFWSKRAAESTEIEREWRHALPRRDTQPGFIRPVYWRKPLSGVPRELKPVQFTYVDLGGRVGWFRRLFGWGT